MKVIKINEVGNMQSFSDSIVPYFDSVIKQAAHDTMLFQKRSNALDGNNKSYIKP